MILVLFFLKSFANETSLSLNHQLIKEGWRESCEISLLNNSISKTIHLTYTLNHPAFNFELPNLNNISIDESSLGIENLSENEKNKKIFEHKRTLISEQTKKISNNVKIIYKDYEEKILNIFSKLEKDHGIKLVNFLFPPVIVKRKLWKSSLKQTIVQKMKF